MHISIMKHIGSLAIAVLLAVSFASAGQALQEPRPLATDGRIKTVRYNPNEVYQFTGHYGFQSIIEFSGGEEIDAVSIGDSIAWQVSPAGNRLFIKPVEQDALTNMTVITTRGIYQFELHAEETENVRDKAMIFMLKFIYPADYSETGPQGPANPVPDFSDPEIFQHLNFGYSIVGPEFVSPVRIFDDGEFTYFQFRDKNAEVPAFFYVDPDGSEGILNFRTYEDYIIVERVAPVFTLRNGPYVICIFNENMPMPPRVAPVEEGNFFQRMFD